MQARAQYRRGQIAVILTLAVPALIAAIAFGTDIAVLYMNWTQLQRSADTAVSAGAAYLPSDPAEAVITARNYARICGISSDEIVSTEIGADRASISMTVTRRVSLITHFLGLGQGNVAVNSTATVRSVQPGNSVKAPWLRASRGNFHRARGQC
jgi:uncharacterized membrane protein